MNSVSFTTDQTNNKRPNSVSVLTSRRDEFSTNDAPSPQSAEWTKIFYSQLLSRKTMVPINSVVGQLAVHSAATRTSNLAAGGNDEPGILTIAEVEIYREY